jgi:predicted molibdopterin-dependent oxidoreductase YjgC
MVNLKINNIDYEVADGLTILEFAKTCGIYIPTLCHKEGLPHYSSCMVCMVRDKRTGNFLPSCTALTQEGMDIDTESEQVNLLRKKAVEMLLSEHRAECEAPCHVVCPAGYDVPKMNRLFSAGDFKGAAELSAGQTENDVLKCIDCSAYCENACRRKKIDLPVSIRNLQIFIYQQNIQKGIKSEKTITSEKRSKRFTSRIGKLETEELAEWLKECTNGDKRSREISDSDSAVAESGSCMHCDCRAADNCRLRDIAKEFSVKDPKGKIVNSAAQKKINSNTGLIFENAKCIKCGLCVRLCEQLKEEPALCFINRGFLSIISEPLTEDFNNVLRTRSKEVAEICPTGALTLRAQGSGHSKKTHPLTNPAGADLQIRASDRNPSTP